MPRAVVAGGSLGGLMAANLLHRAGWSVSVAERTPGPLSGRGAGIVTHPALLDALWAAGVDAQAPVGVRVAGRVALAPDGAVLARLDLPQTLTSWSRLYRLLLDALPRPLVRRGRALVGLAAEDGAVAARFADGTVERAELLVGADGLRSTVRGLCLPGIGPRDAGYVAWRGVVPEGALSAGARAALMGRFAFCLPPGEQILGYPVAGAGDGVAEGSRGFNFVWYRPAGGEEGMRRFRTDAQGRHHPHGVPPGAVAPGLCAEARADAARLLAPAFAEAVAGAAPLFVQAIQDLEVPRMAFGRTALLGDAAFVARPHLGMGVTKAAQDAVALVAALEEAEGDVPAALRRYEAARRPAGAALVAEARRLGEAIGLGGAGPAADAARIAATLAETAVDPAGRRAAAALSGAGAPPPR